MIQHTPAFYVPLALAFAYKGKGDKLTQFMANYDELFPYMQMDKEKTAQTYNKLWMKIVLLHALILLIMACEIVFQLL